MAKNLLNRTRPWAAVALHMMAWYSRQIRAQNSVAETIVQYFSPCQLVLFSETLDERLPQLALEIISQAPTLEFPLESLEDSYLFRKAHYRFKHQQTCVVYLTFHPTPQEMARGKLDLLQPFFEMVVDSYGWPEQEPGTFEGGRDLMVNLIDLSISPWSPGVEKYLSGRHVYYPCMFSPTIIIEYELQSEYLTLFAAQMNCKSGMRFCVEPVLTPTDEGGWTYATIREHLRLRRMQFNESPVMIQTDRTGAERELALQPYVALGAKFNFTA